MSRSGRASMARGAYRSCAAQGRGDRVAECRALLARQRRAACCQTASPFSENEASRRAARRRGDDPRVVNFNTNEALVNTRTGDVVGSGPVASSTPTGQVASKSFDVKNKGDVLIFKGGVHGRLNQH